MTEQVDARRMLEQAEHAATAGDLESAAELLRGAARIQEAELGPLHPDLANTLNNLAVVAEKTGGSSEAETLYRRAAAIAAASLPPDHPMVVASRQNLEDFCRARGLSVHAPAQPPPAPTPSQAAHALAWVATGTVVLVAAMVLVLRPWSSRNASSPAPAPEPAAERPADALPPRLAAPSTRPAPIEQARPPAAAPHRDNRNVATNKPGDVTLVTAQLCRAFSTSGGSWRCDPVGQSVAPGRLTLYTRATSPRDNAVVHRWYNGRTLRQSVTLRIQANTNEGYRTYSRLTVDEGDWRLEVRSTDGRLLHEQRFAVR